VAVDPVQFTAGPVSQAAAAMLAGGTAAYAVLTGWYAVRAFRAGLEDRWSALLATLVMAALAGVLLARGAELVPAPFSIALLAVYAISIAITLTYTLGRYQERIAVFTTKYGKRLNAILADLVPEERQAEWDRLRSAFTPTPEQRRKTPHLLMGIILVIYGAGFLLLRGIWDAAYGGHPVEGAGFAGEGILNLYAATHASVGTWLVAGQMLGVFCLLGLLYLLVPTELLRLRFPELSYPFKSIILSRLRRREKGLFGAHYYIAATTPLAALWLTRDPAHWDVTIYAVLATISIAVFADAASALVGIRWGRRKWFHNPNKSYLGSVGGTAVAFAVALPFVGLPVAIASAAVFLVVDIWAPKPISISDNILNPLALMGAYGFLVPYMDPWFPYY
jgi:dolichol kinase